MKIWHLAVKLELASLSLKKLKNTKRKPQRNYDQLPAGFTLPRKHLVTQFTTLRIMAVSMLSS